MITADEFFGIILLSGAFCLQFYVAAMSFFYHRPRRFLLYALSYKDKFEQQFNRFMFVLGIGLMIVGALVAALSDDGYEHTVSAVLFKVLYYCLATWVIQKIILAVAVVIWMCWRFIEGEDID